MNYQKELPLGSQQFISDETPMLNGQDAQNSPFLHSLSLSQSPSFTPQEFESVQQLPSSLRSPVHSHPAE